MCRLPCCYVKLNVDGGEKKIKQKLSFGMVYIIVGKLLNTQKSIFLYFSTFKLLSDTQIIVVSFSFVKLFLIYYGIITQSSDMVVALLQFLRIFLYIFVWVVHKFELYD